MWKLKCSRVGALGLKVLKLRVPLFFVFCFFFFFPAGFLNSWAIFWVGVALKFRQEQPRAFHIDLEAEMSSLQVGVDALLSFSSRQLTLPSLSSSTSPRFDGDSSTEDEEDNDQDEGEEEVVGGRESFKRHVHHRAVCETHITGGCKGDPDDAAIRAAGMCAPTTLNDFDLFLLSDDPDFFARHTPCLSPAGERVSLSPGIQPEICHSVHHSSIQGLGSGAQHQKLHSPQISTRSSIQCEPKAKMRKQRRVSSKSPYLAPTKKRAIKKPFVTSPRTLRKVRRELADIAAELARLKQRAANNSEQAHWRELERRAGSV